MYYLNLDENSYLLSVNSVDNGDVCADIKLSDYDFSGLRLSAYKWENNSLLFDEARLSYLEEKEAQNEKVTAAEDRRIADLEEALDLLLSGETE